jgi:hypothetical protein
VQAGGYAVRVGDDPDGSAGFFLAEDAPLRSQEGGGQIYSIPPGIIPLHNFLYLPTLMSEK